MGSTEKGTFKQRRCKRAERSGRGASQFKGREAGVRLMCLRNSEDVAGVESGVIRREVSHGFDVRVRGRRITDDTKIFDLSHWKDVIN